MLTCLFVININGKTHMNMKSKFLISTTNNIEGTPIKRYIGALCSNIVIGTNVFSDFAASFTDFLVADLIHIKES